MAVSPKKGTFIFILISEQIIIGTWISLNQLCREMKEQGAFASYSKLSKDLLKMRQDGAETGSLHFTTKEGKAFTIQVDKLK